ncbi:hypothetical protein [Pelagibius marinus]|uniref:hypothetical protein n=1 Tax=Pelagibius marinus TaxID=2762760 RepID=UPI001872A617|nr:hypothetical protein [Pelagibius marinus]
MMSFGRWALHSASIALPIIIIIGTASAQDGAPLAGGLPPAPTYTPGTAITPESEAKGAVAKRAKSKAWRGEIERNEAGHGRQAVQDAGPVAAMESRESLLLDKISPVQTDLPVWQNLVPLLPGPGDFAVIPGSELRPRLVRKDEFSFCDELKCHRSGAVLSAWNGAAFDGTKGELRLHGGGHADYGGNEVYAFDFSSLTWMRETDPQPLTGPMLSDSDGDGVADACPAPAEGPPATHTYQGFVYVPKIDRYWLFGTVEYCASGTGGQSAWEYDAHRRSWTPMPELDRYAKFSRAVIDPATGNVIVHVGRKNGWHEIDPRSRTLVRSFRRDPFGSYIDGTAVFDHVRRVIYAVVEARTRDRLVAYQLPDPSSGAQSEKISGRVVAEWEKQGKKAWGMAQHASGLLVLWDGNTRIVTVNPQTGQAWEMQTGGDAYRAHRGGGKPGRVYSKWAYIPELDTFFGITNADMGMVLYRLGGNATPDPGQLTSSAAHLRKGAAAPATDRRPKEPAARALPAPGAAAMPAASGTVNAKPTPVSEPHKDDGWAVPLEIEASASWESVCSTAVLCDPLGSGEVLYRGRVVEAGPPQRRGGWRRVSQRSKLPDAEVPSADPVTGGLRFTFPSRSGSGAAGNFATNFSPDYSFQIGPADAGAPAQEVFIQFQVRYSCTFIWTDCDPSSAGYRKQRRCFLSKRGEGRCTASKIALISTGDQEGFTADACTRIQIALNHGTDHSLHGFHRCPRAQGFGQRLGRVGGRRQGDSQPNGLYYCPRIRNDGSQKTWNNSPDTCFRLIDDRWITIQVRLRFGPWQSNREKGATKLSHVSIWAGIEGQDAGRQRLVIDNDFYAVDPKGRDLIGKIWLMPHLYNKTPKEDHPPFFVWYRNLVVAETLVPNPV